MTMQTLAATLTPTRLVRLELRARPGRYLTASLLAELTGLTVADVHHAIYELSKQRKVVRRVPSNVPRGRVPQAYAWDYRGLN